jgi:ParB family chromosome partitioning protein
MANLESPKTDKNTGPGERKALGRGLAALFQDVETTAKSQQIKGAASNTAAIDAAPVLGPGRMLYLSEIERNAEQPRKHFDEAKLQELADSLREQGLVQPIVVKQLATNRYQIVAGERRWRAAGLAGLKQIPAFVRDDSKTETENDLASLVENIQREQLNPIELAEAYERTLKKSELTQEALAKKLGLSRTAIANTLRLLKLPEQIRQMVVEGKLSEGHSRALLSLGSETAMLQMAQRIVEGALSVRDTEGVVRSSAETRESAGGGASASLAGKAGSAGVETQKSADLKAVENELREIFGTKVIIKGSDTRGMIELFYTGSDSLDRLVHLLRAARA